MIVFKQPTIHNEILPRKERKKVIVLEHTRTTENMDGMCTSKNTNTKERKKKFTPMVPSNKL
jgi:hypothetical protein